MKIILSFILILTCGLRTIVTDPIIEFVPGLSAYTDYEDGLAKAQSSQKPVLIYFKDKRSGSCTKIEKNVFSDDKVKAYISKTFLVICLATEDSSPSSKNPKLKTAGEYNYHIQRSKYKKDYQPYIAILNKKGEFVKGVDYTSDPSDFLKSLKGTKF